MPTWFELPGDRRHMMAPVYLSSSAFLAITHNAVVFLDLRTNRYRCIVRDAVKWQDHHLRTTQLEEGQPACVSELFPKPLANELLALDLLTTDPNEANCHPFVRLEVAQRELHGDLRVQPSLGTIVRFTLARATARRLVRRGTLRTIASSLEARGNRLLGTQARNNVTNIASVTQQFACLQPW